MDKFVSRNNPFNILRKNHGITDSDVYDRLEAYENTGLEPYEIVQLRAEIERLRKVEDEYNEWKTGKRGVEEYLTLQQRYRDRIKEIDKLKCEIRQLKQELFYEKCNSD